MKPIRVFAALAVGLLAYFGWSALHLQKVAASNDPSGTYLIHITDAAGAFASDSVITLHADHSVAAIDSRQDGGGNYVPFSSLRGVWKRDSHGVIKARTINWDFPYANNGSARVDYTFDRNHSPNQVKGSIVLTFFAYGVSPLSNSDDGTPGGTFHFTGARVTIP